MKISFSYDCYNIFKDWVNSMKRNRGIKRIILLAIVTGIFIFSFLLDKKKVDTIPVSYFKSNEDYSTFVRNYNSYPEELIDMFSRNPDMAEYILGYPEKKGKVYSDTIGQIERGEVPLLLQYDVRWGYGFYGDDVIAINGCGPTALSMVIAYLTHNNTITPYVVAQYSNEHGYYETGIGSSWNLMTTGSIHFGIIGNSIPLSKDRIYQELESGHPIICSMGPGAFTRTGHFIVLTKIEDGRIKVNDPNSLERSRVLWDYETLSSQIKGLWAFEKV